MAHDEQDQVDGWQRFSEWIDDIRFSSEVISKYDNNPKFHLELLQCKSNYERFKLIWTNKELRAEINQHYQHDLGICKKKRENRIKKSSSESTKMRQLGNTSFKGSNYLKALEQYTQAIKFAPYPSRVGTEDKSLAFALANRSAVLYALTRYRLCLLDIDLAIKFGYPEESMFKLLIRKVKCLHILSVWANDVEQIKDNLKNMLKNRDTDKSVKTEIRNMFSFLESALPEDMDKDELDVIDETAMKISNASKTVSQAADCVEMSYDSEKGRYLMLNKDVTFGRLLIAEEPFVCNLAPQNRDEYCYHCFGRLYSCGLSCTNCSEVLFCSEECLESSEQVHSIECDSFIDLQNILGVAYIVAHLMFKVDFNLESFHTYTKKSSEKKTLDEVLGIQATDWPDLVYKNSYTSVLSLMDHSTDYDYDEMMGYACTAAYLLTAFIDQCTTKYSKLSEESNQLVIGSVLLRHLLQLQTNLISILDQNLQDLQKAGMDLTKVFEKPIGVGIYPTVCLLNHSCSPNILSIFHRNKFIARASRALECGTEVNYCYGPSVARNTRRDRQKRLKEQYFFTCFCDSCTENKENECRALLCPECRGPVIYNQDFSNQCSKCKVESIVDAKGFLEQINEIESLIDDELVGSDNISNRIERLKNLEESLSQIAYWKHPLFIKIKAHLSDSAIEIEDFELALKFYEDELNLCSKTHGPESYEVIVIKLKLINARWLKICSFMEGSPTGDSKKSALAELKSLSSSINIVRAKLKELLGSTNIPGAEASYDEELDFLSTIQNQVNRCLDHYGDIANDDASAQNDSKHG